MKILIILMLRRPLEKNVHLLLLKYKRTIVLPVQLALLLFLQALLLVQCNLHHHLDLYFYLQTIIARICMVGVFVIIFVDLWSHGNFLRILINQI
ncbi:hypothetical protein KSF78_0003609 [Schistosoma japonicum]|nr:hypothetical protein KSF78_0003609 [Schistosoma japonicum]